MFIDIKVAEEIGEDLGKIILKLVGEATWSYQTLVDYLNTCRSSLYNFFTKDKSVCS